ncbi:MAG: TlpA family protein disulfide reductase [Deltaproteobacteria bacterium]|nr:TlpA family protein disulfide reductase [Deltaproteobacteria bacterium]MCL4872843.1 TlpA family protein disulfide reductase [bacterium]
MKTILLLVLLAFFATACGERPGKEGGSPYEPRLAQGSPAIDFLHKDMDGAQFRLSEEKGRVVILYFWRMKCSECREELKSLDWLRRKYRERGLIVAAIGADSMHSAPLFKVREFLDKEGLRFVNIRDEDGFVAEAYRVMRAPEAYIIGKDGRIALVVKGPSDWTGPETSAFLDKLLSE